MERLTLKEMLKFYLQWCNDNNLEPKNARNFVAYVQEIKLLCA